MLQSFNHDTAIIIDGVNVPGRISYLWDRTLRTWEINGAYKLTSNGRAMDVFEEFKESYTAEWDAKWNAVMEHMYPGSMSHGAKMRQMRANKRAQF